MGSVILIGCWERGWNYPLLEADLWSYPARDFGVKQVIMTPVSGISHKGIQERHSVEEALDEVRGHAPVFVDEAGDTRLKDFTHPSNAVYIFGRASYSPMRALGGSPSVWIETPHRDGLLWAHQAMVLTLADREAKG